jgi:two-component system LytT family response regulator
MNAIIIDDEKEIRTGLKILLKPYPFIEVVAEACNVVEAKYKIELLKPDLVFLDIQLKDSNGFKMLDQLDFLDFNLIFVTAFNDYAVKAFKYNAFDYLLKPIDPLELDNTLNRLTTSSVSGRQLIQQSLGNQDLHRIVVKTAKEIFVIEMKDIVRCEASQGYTYFHLNNAKRILSSKTLKEYEEIMPSSQFIRVHQSHLVNLNYVSKYVRDGNILLKNTEEIPVSIRKRQEFLTHFNQFSTK